LIFFKKTEALTDKMLLTDIGLDPILAKP